MSDRHFVSAASVSGRLLSAAMGSTCQKPRALMVAEAHQETEEGFAVTDHVVAQLKQHGDPWELSEEAKPNRGQRRSDSTW